MSQHRGYTISIEKTRTGYGAVISPGIAVCVTGKTKEETLRLAREGIDLWIEFAPMSFEEAMPGAPRREIRRLARSARASRPAPAIKSKKAG